MPIITKTKPETENETFNIFQQCREDGSIAYSAGFPHYPRNFSRDTIIAGIIASNIELLDSQLEISARHQGKKEDPHTGEKPGKIHHEYPGVPVNNRKLFSTYNACDTTALFLIAAEGMSILDKNKTSKFIKLRKDNLERAVDHIVQSIDNNYLSWETPPHNSSSYALKVTYWKDSILPDISGKTEPVYPVIYPLAQFITARGLLSASRILNDSSLGDIADAMYRAGIKRFIRNDGYVSYQDKDGELLQSSSDELHSLAYIPKKYQNLLPLKSISKRADELSTPYGYLCTPMQISNKLNDRYHANSVWIFEQAMIHYAATKFGLDQEMNTAALVAKHIGEGQELLTINYNGKGELTADTAGNDRQLWSKASAEYFAGSSVLLYNNWL